jgi:hypothetical protein
MYPGFLEERIHLLEDTRVRRLIESVPRLSEEERKDLLQKYHPDYIASSMRQLGVGVNKGDSTPVELADLLEGNSRLDLPRRRYWPMGRGPEFSLPPNCVWVMPTL